MLKRNTSLLDLLRYLILVVLFAFGIITIVTSGGGGDGDGSDGDGNDNQWPTASFTADPTTGALPLMVTFDASTSDDPDGRIISYEWDFGDGAIESGNTNIISHEYTSTGTYTVILTVFDDEEGWAEANTTIVVNRIIWSFEVDKPVYYSSPAIGADGTIYFATGILIHSSYGSIYAVTSDGILKWKFDLDNNSDDDNIWTNDNNGASPAMAADGTIYMMDHRNVVYALNPDGTLKWKNNAYESDAAWHVGQKTPAIGADGTLYIGAGLTLYALDPEDGQAKWQLDGLRGGNVCAVSAVVGGDGTIYLASNDMFYAVNPDGTQKWSSPFKLLYENEKSFSSPAIGSDGTIYFGAERGEEGHVYAVNQDGTQKWRYVVPGKRPVRASPAIAPDGTVYVTTKAYFETEKMPALCLALNPDDGSVKWIYTIEPSPSIPVAQDSYTSPAVGADGTIFFAAENCYVYALNPDGTLKWQEHLQNGINWSSPAIIPDGTLYIGAHHTTAEGSWLGKLVAIRTESLGLIDSSWPKFRHDNSNTGRHVP